MRVIRKKYVKKRKKKYAIPSNAEEFWSNDGKFKEFHKQRFIEQFKSSKIKSADDAYIMAGPPII